jgi:probable O-glycosylation ligase (exosortase A-associated)
MPQKPHVLDYEPVLRTGSGIDSVDAHAEEWFDPPELSPDQEQPLLPEQKAETVEPAKPYQQVKTWKTLHQKAHSVSYFGLVLFTIILYYRPYELSTSLVWMQSSAFVVAVFTLLFYIPTQLGLHGNLTVRPREINLILLFLLAAVLSLPLAIEQTWAWNTFQTFLKVVLMFIVMVNVVLTRKRLRALILLALFTSCILSASAVNDYRLGKLALGNERIQGLIGNLFDNPNDLALHLVTMIPLAIAFLMVSRSGIKKLIFAGAAVLMVAGVVATFSRGGFIGTIVIFGMLAWRLSKRNKLLIATCLPVALILFMIFAPGGYRTRLGTTADDSAGARYDELKRSIFVALHHPILGVGMNNYVNYSNLNHATHNAYTQVASELGIPAMVIYIMFLIAPLKRLRRIERETISNREKSEFYYFAIGLEVSLIGYMTASFFLSVAYLWYLYYLVAYTICLARLYEWSLQGKPAQLAASTVLKTNAVRSSKSNSIEVKSFS